MLHVEHHNHHIINIFWVDARAMEDEKIKCIKSCIVLQTFGLTRKIYLSSLKIMINGMMGKDIEYDI